MPVGGIIPLQSFQPDLDPLTPGVITDGNDFVPSMSGFRTLPDLLACTQPLPDTCRGIAALTFADGSQWIVAGCCNDQGGNVSLNVVRAVDLSIDTPPAWRGEFLPDAAVPGKWRFAVWQNPNTELAGQEIVAVDGVHPPLSATRQALESDPSVAWRLLSAYPDSVGAPPIASHVAASDFYLFLVGDLQADIRPIGALPVVTNHWWASSNSHVWDLVIGLTTISVDGRLGQSSGPITAIQALRSTMIAYKANATYVGTLTQPPFIWDFVDASLQTGAQGQEGVLPIRDTHSFVGPDDFFTMDGFAINPIPNALRFWFNARVNRAQRELVQTRFDQLKSVAFLHFPSGGTPDAPVMMPTEWIALNYVTGAWAVGQLVIQATMRQTIKFGDTAVSGVVKTDRALYVYVGDGSLRTQPGAFLVTGDIGDRRYLYETQPIRPAFTTLTGTPTLTPLIAYYSGQSPYTQGPTVPITADGWFNLQSMGRLQRFRIDAVATMAVPPVPPQTDVEIVNLDIPMKPSGDA